jgi:hypothetical protein
LQGKKSFSKATFDCFCPFPLCDLVLVWALVAFFCACNNDTIGVS